MKCEDCSSEATHFINAAQTPVCQRCMIESLCSVPTAVISREAYEAAQIVLKGATQDGQGKDYPRAS